MTKQEIKALRRESSTLSSGAAMYFVPELEDKDDPAALREAPPVVPPAAPAA